jgi:hypothetical protein
MTATAPDAPAAIDHLLRRATELAANGHALDAVDLLHDRLRQGADPRIERRLAALRYTAFDELAPASRFPTWPVAMEGLDPAPAPVIPQIAPSALSAEAVRRAILEHGCVHIPGFFDPATVTRFVDGIETALQTRIDLAETPGPSTDPWFSGLPTRTRDEAISLARPWVAGDGGMLACDSPRLLEMVLTAYEERGLRELLTDYLGERPILSANKATLRRARLEGSTDWHQDGAFLGSTAGIRALNVWVTLTDCGVDAPSMDIVPKRFDSVQETGTGGAIFDWAVGPDTVAELSVDAPVVRPVFQAGDAMLFDDMLLHRTALSPEMTRTRHAIESWFFAATNYPAGQVPLVW